MSQTCANGFPSLARAVLRAELPSAFLRQCCALDFGGEECQYACRIECKTESRKILQTECLNTWDIMHHVIVYARTLAKQNVKTVYFPDRMPGKMAQFCNAPAERDV